MLILLRLTQKKIDFTDSPLTIANMSTRRQTIEQRRQKLELAYQAQLRAFDEEEAEIERQFQKKSGKKNHVETLVELIEDVKHLIPDQKYIDMMEVLSELHSG